MEASEKDWYDTEALARRWECTRDTVSARAKRALDSGVQGAKPTKVGRKNHWRADDVRAIEASWGARGLFDR